MRSNAMKACATGAMLFGGTLGVVSTAQAGLVWLRGGNVGDPTSALASVQVGDGSASGSFADYNAYAEGVALSDPFNFPSLSTTFGASAGGAPSMLFSGTDNFTGGSDTGGFSFSSTAIRSAACRGATAGCSTCGCLKSPRAKAASTTLG